MVRKTDLITSKEFAARVGISPSAVNASKKLEPFRHTIKGNNYVELKALELYGIEPPKVALPVRRTKEKAKVEIPPEVMELINSMAKEIQVLKNKMLVLEAGKTNVRPRGFRGGWGRR